MVSISRNQVLETRDWTSASEVPITAGARSGIYAGFVTPPSTSIVGADFAFEVPTFYEPGLPALRVEHNVVRVPLGETLVVFGFGPFSIVNNHFTCGGFVRAARRPIAQTVVILNLGVAIESNTVASTYTSAYDSISSSAAGLGTNTQLSTSSGAVTFTNNVCQLEARQMGQRAFSSVLILTLDSLNFSDNHCWVDGPELSASVDAMLLAGSLQVTSNRFQEAPGFSVLVSGIALGVMNITTQNIPTYCLFAEGSTPAWTINTNNLTVIPPTVCTGSLTGR